VLAHERIKLPNTVTFHDENQFESILARMEKEGRLPAILEVNTSNEPFWSDSGGSAAGGSGSWHALTITDYDAQKRKVSICNQWVEWPRAIALKDLYQSTLPPGAGYTAPRLKTGEQKALDFATELVLLWQQRSRKGISSERFDQQIASLLNRAHSEMLRRSTAEAELDHRKLEMNFARVFASLPTDEQEVVAAQLDSSTAPSLMKTLELMQEQ
jgi:hypothetical protein